MHLVFERDGVRVVASPGGRTVWEPSPRNKRRCHYCGSWIDKEADKCPHCMGPQNLRTPMLPQLYRSDYRRGIISIPREMFVDLRFVAFPFPDGTHFTGWWENVQEWAMDLVVEHPDLLPCAPGMRALRYDPLWMMGPDWRSLKFEAWRVEDLSEYGTGAMTMYDVARRMREWTRPPPPRAPQPQIITM